MYLVPMDKERYKYWIRGELEITSKGIIIHKQFDHKPIARAINPNLKPLVALSSIDHKSAP